MAFIAKNRDHMFLDLIDFFFSFFCAVQMYQRFTSIKNHFEVPHIYDSTPQSQLTIHCIKDLLLHKRKAPTLSNRE